MAVEFVAAWGGVVGKVADAILRTVFGVQVSRSLLKRGTFDDRLAEITEQLESSATDAQTLLEEMQRTIKERSKAVADVQARVEELRDQEVAARKELEELQAVKPEAAQAINRLVGNALDVRDQRSSKRDLLIFVLGIVFSVITGAVVQIAYGIWVGDITMPSIGR